MELHESRRPAGQLVMPTLGRRIAIALLASWMWERRLVVLVPDPQVQGCCLRCGLAMDPAGPCQSQPGQHSDSLVRK